MILSVIFVVDAALECRPFSQLVLYGLVGIQLLQSPFYSRSVVSFRPVAWRSLFFPRVSCASHLLFFVDYKSGN